MKFFYHTALTTPTTHNQHYPSFMFLSNRSPYGRLHLSARLGLIEKPPNRAEIEEMALDTHFAPETL
ncbi:hypothetical protein JTE90_012594 [Oedothorax gibbosus]|uniref:Uncharacterized protein n=1 Tax=Oedothorax gibbosus TaxID=931172 RepID=A0AAV6V365_9ARAC|nr:hypothetical protein JTE90_012594 [Oedothorax gibbosus]